MTKHLKIALAQLNPVVGDLDGNAEKLIRARDEAARLGADLVLFSELFITGYPPEDLVRRPAFAAAARARVEALAAELGPGPAVLTGALWPESDKLYNAMVLIDGGKIEAVRTKVDLPNYGVFDEKRVFDAGPLPGPINFRGVRLGVPICEDIWKDEVCECLAECGAEMLLVPNGSPFDWKKPDVRLNVAVARVTETGLPLAYLNQLGGQDELVFDGASFVLNADCSLAVQMPAWEEAITLTEWTKGADGWACKPGQRVSLEDGEAAAYLACMNGLRDYVRRTGSLASYSACPAASTALSSRRWRPMHWGRSACTRSCCPTGTPRRKAWRMRLPARRRFASATTWCRSSSQSRASRMR